MSFSISLDEYSYERLANEIARRNRLRKAGLCDYCERAGGTSPCKFPYRHMDAVTDDRFANDLVDSWHGSEAVDKLHEFMKLSWEEYRAFVEHKKFPIGWRERFK